MLFVTALRCIVVPESCRKRSSPRLMGLGWAARQGIVQVPLVPTAAVLHCTADCSLSFVLMELYEAMGNALVGGWWLLPGWLGV